MKARILRRKGEVLYKAKVAFKCMDCGIKLLVPCMGQVLDGKYEDAGFYVESLCVRCCRKRIVLEEEEKTDGPAH